jgi:putative flavoprotein involved in K+ transport
VLVIDAEGYRDPDGLPGGRVLVVGSGQTGCQISEELNRAGRDVLLACGRAPWLPRRASGRDLVTWLWQTSFFEQPLAALPSPGERLVANPQLSGRDGGHDLNYRTLKAAGVQLVGHLRGIQGGRASFADDLADSVAFGDQRYERVCNLLTDELTAAGFSPPELPPAEPFQAVAPTEVGMHGIGAVIFTSGFRPDYSSWVELSGFDELGFPITRDGTSLAIPGLYFAGVHFLRKRKSSLLFGVGEDAAIVAGAIAQRLNAPD